MDGTGDAAAQATYGTAAPTSAAKADASSDGPPVNRRTFSPTCAAGAIGP
jgi:hypothetical protein